MIVLTKRSRRIGLTSDTYGRLIGKGGKQAAEAAAAIVPPKRTA